MKFIGLNEQLSFMQHGIFSIAHCSPLNLFIYYHYYYYYIQACISHYVYYIPLLTIILNTIIVEYEEAGKRIANKSELLSFL